MSDYSLYEVCRPDRLGCIKYDLNAIHLAFFEVEMLEGRYLALIIMQLAHVVWYERTMVKDAVSSQYIATHVPI